MDLNFTTKSQEALSAAVREAGAHGNAHVEPAHLLKAVLGQDDGIAVALLNGLDVDIIDLKAAVDQAVNAIPSATGASVASPQLSNESYRVLNDAQKLATDRGDEYISTEHILIALAQSPSVGPLLDERGATPAALMDALANVRGSSRVTNADPEASFQALEKYGTDLTALARDGKIDPVIGRDHEIRRVMQVCRDEPRTTRS